MNANKIELNGEVLLDLTQDTATPETVGEGVTFHMADGTPSVGTAKLGGDDFPADKYFEGTHAEVNLPNATQIKAYAFYQDKTITKITMPQVTSIGNNAFYTCSNLETVDLPDSVTYIGSNAFYQCSKFKLSEIPSSIKTIGGSAFAYNPTSSVTFKGTPSSIGSGAFTYCYGLKTINVPWAEGQVSGAPWGATNATINYNYTGE